MTTRRAVVLWRALAGVAVLGATLVLSPGATVAGRTGSTAGAAPAPVPAVAARPVEDPRPDGDSVGVTLVAQPAWVGPSGLVSVTVRIAQPPKGARLATTLYDRVPNREALQRSLFAQFGNAITPNGLSSKSLDPLPRDTDGSVTATVSFALSPNRSDPPELIEVPAAGVYPLGVQVLDRSGQRVGQLVTWIIRLPDAPSALGSGRTPLDVALVLPLHAGPSHRADGSVEITTGARDRVRGLVQALAGSGDVPLTVVPTPEVVDSLAASNASADRDLLSRLRLLTGVPGRAVLAGPYVDLDLPAWLRQPSLRDRAAVEWSRGAQTLQTQLGTDPLEATAVSPADLTNDAVRWLHDQGIRRLLVPASAVEPNTDLPTRPFTVSSGTGASLEALAVNDVAQVGFGMDDSRRGLQVILAALAQTSLDAPSGPQETVLAPQLTGDSWAADPQRLAALLNALTTTTAGGESGPLVQLVPLASAFQLPPATTTPTATTPVTVHAVDADPPSLADFDQRFATVQHQLASFRQMLVTSPGAAGGSNAGLVRATAFDQLLGIAGSDELSVANRNQFLDGVAGTLRRELGSVAAPTRQTVTLTSRSGSIPFTLHNTLGYPVQVRLQMESSERLAFPDGTTQTLTLTGENTPIEIRVRTRTSGDAPLTITVTSPDGSLLLATTDYTVRSTAVSGVGLALTIGAALVLVVWWLRSLYRGRKAKRAGPAAPEST